MNILIIDDDIDCLNSISDTLELNGFTIEKYVNPSRAINTFLPEKFDAIITDYKMDPFDGATLIRSLKRIDKHIPIILISGYMEQEMINQELSDMVYRFFHKPVQVEELIETLHGINSGESPVKGAGPYKSLIGEFEKLRQVCDRL